MEDLNNKLGYLEKMKVQMQRTNYNGDQKIEEKQRTG